MHEALVPTLNVKITLRGQRSSRFFSVTKKTSKASVIKLHAKVNGNVR